MSDKPRLARAERDLARAIAHRDREKHNADTDVPLLKAQARVDLLQARAASRREVS